MLLWSWLRALILNTLRIYGKFLESAPMKQVIADIPQHYWRCLMPMQKKKKAHLANVYAADIKK